MDAAVQAQATPAASNGHSTAMAGVMGEIRSLRRAYLRRLKLRGRPPADISALISTATLATVIAHQAMADPAVGHNDRVRLVGMAKRARAEVEHAIANRAEPPTPLKELLRYG